ncbi:unnamed protein product, partial [Linum tenue]
IKLNILGRPGRKSLLLLVFISYDPSILQSSDPAKLAREMESEASPIVIVLLPVLVTLSLILLASQIILRTKKEKKLGLPPGPRKLPIIGNLHQLAAGRSSSLPHRRLRDLARQYGPDMMHLQLGETSNVVVSSPELARAFLKTHDRNFATRPTLPSATIIFYNARDIAFAPYGEYWRQMRKICSLELLSAKRVSSLRPIREEEVGKLVMGLMMGSDPQRPGEGVNLGRLLGSLSCTITSRATFGKIQDLEESFLSVQRRIMKALGEFAVGDVFPSSWLLRTITGTERRLKKLHREADVILQGIIDEHVSRGGRSGSETALLLDHDDDGRDLVDVLLSFTHGDQVVLGFTLTHVEIKAVIMDIFFGAIDTSAVTVEWAMSELMKNPEEMEKAQKEVRRVFDGKGKVVDEASLDELPYLKSIVKETFRLHPPAPLLVPRESRETIVINGYQIPAGTKVLINAWAIGRDPTHWHEPDKFIPERFLNNSINYEGDNFQFIPFGAGRRVCPGIKSGSLVVHLTLANLLYHFDWMLPNQMKSQALDMSEVFGISIHKKYDLHLIPIPYQAP